MKEQKQEYQRPVVEVLVVESNDIICSSTEPAVVHGSGINQIQSPLDGGSL